MSKIENASRLEVAKIVADSGRKQTQGDAFGKFAAGASGWLGSKWAFVGAIVIIAVWAITGPLFNYSDTWQLIINTGTTIITFLMVFIIQNTQNRDAEAMHIKLDELIRAMDQAQNALLNLEELEEDDLERIRADYLRLAERARVELRDDGHSSTENT